MEHTIKSIDKEDLPYLILLHRLVYWETYSHILPKNYLNQMTMDILFKYWSRIIENPASEAKFIIQNKIIIGFYSVVNSRLKNYHEKELANIYILDEYQNNGIGRTIFADLLQSYSKLIIVVLKENIKANNFYLSRGGVIVETRFNYYGDSDREENIYLISAPMG